MNLASGDEIILQRPGLTRERARVLSSEFGGDTAEAVLGRWDWENRSWVYGGEPIDVTEADVVEVLG